MKERGLLMSAPMVRATMLDIDPKWQTRRIAKFDSDPGLSMSFTGLSVHRFGKTWRLMSKSASCWEERSKSLPSPYGLEGERLWVREAWRTLAEANDLAPRELMNVEAYTHYEADQAKPKEMGRLRPGMFMPRWASRITLEIIGIRIERLWDITEADAYAEGITQERVLDYLDTVERMNQTERFPARELYKQLWEEINGDGSWDLNPYVWVISFRRVK